MFRRLCYGVSQRRFPLYCTKNNVISREVDILSKIVKSLEKNGHKVFVNVDEYAKQSIIPILLKYRVQDDDICTLVTENPKLLNFSGQKLTPYLECFVNSGISLNSALLALVEIPDLLTINDEILFARLQMLKQVVSNKTALRLLLETNPEVLQQSTNNMESVKENLNSFFTTSQIENMIVKEPRILLMDFKELENLYEYIFYRMGLDADIVAKCNWFAYTLPHLRYRHEFLDRIGMYRFPDRKRPAVAKNNPRLRDIIDTSDRRFVQMCHVTLEEYDTFKDMYKDTLENDEEIMIEVRKNTRRKEYEKYVEEREQREAQLAMEDDTDDMIAYSRSMGKRKKDHSNTDDKPRRVIKQWYNPRYNKQNTNRRIK